MSGITKDDIYAAANKLAADGVMPSNDKIRAALGNTGSEATIQKYLKEWKHDLLLKSVSSCVFCESVQVQLNEAHLQLAEMREVLQSVRQTLLEVQGGYAKEKTYGSTLSM